MHASFAFRLLEKQRLGYTCGRRADSRGACVSGCRVAGAEECNADERAERTEMTG